MSGIKRKVHTSEKALLIGLSFILLFMFVHDWLPLGSLNDVHAVSSEQSFNELIITTLINAGQIIILMAILLIFIGKTYPMWAKIWLIIHQSFIFIGAMFSWWIPYLFGIGAEEKVDRYTSMFGNTHAFLPIRNGIVPNTLHTLFHLTLLLCIILTIYISFSRNKKFNKSNYNKIA